jgi:hypothetical protein
MDGAPIVVAWRVSERSGAELHHQAEDVHDDAGVLDAAFFEAIDDDSPDTDGAACGRDAEEWTVVSAGPLKAADYLIAFGNLFLNGKDQIGEGGTHTAEHVFQSFESGTLAWKWDLLDDVFPDELSGRVDVSLRDDFVYEATNNGGVVLHGCLLGEESGYSFQVTGDSERGLFNRLHSRWQRCDVRGFPGLKADLFGSLIPGSKGPGSLRQIIRLALAVGGFGAVFAVEVQVVDVGGEA